MNSETYVTAVPWRDHLAHLARLSEPDYVYYAVVLPWGADAEADRLRREGLVRVYRCPRLKRIYEVDRVAHRLVRKG